VVQEQDEQLLMTELKLKSLLLLPTLESAFYFLEWFLWLLCKQALVEVSRQVSVEK
jgi:hypothetical protein